MSASNYLDLLQHKVKIEGVPVKARPEKLYSFTASVQDPSHAVRKIKNKVRCGTMWISSHDRTQFEPAEDGTYHEGNNILTRRQYHLEGEWRFCSATGRLRQGRVYFEFRDVTAPPPYAPDGLYYLVFWLETPIDGIGCPLHGPKMCCWSGDIDVKGVVGKQRAPIGPQTHGSGSS